MEETCEIWRYGGTISFGKGICEWKGASINMKRAVDYCVQSAEQEYAPAQALLAHFYGYGKGVEKNYEEMIYWGEKAALQGYAQAQYNVGRCYEQGRARKKILKRQCIGIC